MSVLSLTYKINVFIFCKCNCLKVTVMQLNVKRWKQNLFVQMILSGKCVAGVSVQDIKLTARKATQTRKLHSTIM
jgi:hypothetical protein